MGQNIYSTCLTIDDEKLFYNKNKIYNNVLNLSLNNGYLLIDYIYLDSDERKKFYDNNHHYLIDILEFDNEKNIYNSNEKIKLGY